MSKDEIKAKVLELIAAHLSKDPDDITEDDDFANDLGADSLDTVELVMAIEEEFEIEIPDEVAESIKTVGDLLRALENILGD